MVTWSIVSGKIIEHLAAGAAVQAADSVAESTMLY